MTRDPAKQAAQMARKNAAKKLRRATDPVYREKLCAQARARRTVPKGHRLRGVSTLVDAKGELSKEWQKSEIKPVEPPTYPIEPPGFTKTSQSTMIDRTGGATVQWVRFEKDKAEQWAEMVEAMKLATAEYKGIVLPTPAPELCDARLLNLIPIGDPHIGMLAWGRETGEDFDSKIARTDLLNVLGLLYERSPKAQTCFIAQLGDFFHAEDDEARTPRGKNPLDVDTRAGRITELGYMLMRAAIDGALKRHGSVVVANLRGNHDPYKSLGLNLYLKGVYENEPRVTVLDNNNPYLFWEHGLNLFGFHHGDGAKPEMLPGIMASYSDGKPWGRASYRKWFTGHIHTRKAIDFPGVSWESCRTLAPGDFWAHHKGYRSEQSLECHTFDTEHGLVSRQNVSLLMARRHAA